MVSWRHKATLPLSEALHIIITFCNKLWWIVSPPINPQAEGRPHVGCLWPLIQYIHRCSQYLEAVFPIHNLRKRLAVAPKDSTWILPLRYFSLTVLSRDRNNELLIPPDEGGLCTDVMNLSIKISLVKKSGCLHTKKPSSFFRAHLCRKI
jgi:hypothetical protein